MVEAGVAAAGTYTSVDASAYYGGGGGGCFGETSTVQVGAARVTTSVKNVRKGD